MLVDHPTVLAHFRNGRFIAKLSHAGITCSERDARLMRAARHQSVPNRKSLSETEQLKTDRWNDALHDLDTRFPIDRDPARELITH
jgi:hypothetical protein